MTTKMVQVGALTTSNHYGMALVSKGFPFRKILTTTLGLCPVQDSAWGRLVCFEVLDFPGGPGGPGSPKGPSSPEDPLGQNHP
jgi:hypothetical protein